MVHAQTRKKKYEELTGKVARLERKLRGLQTVEKAKEIIANRQNINPNEAFAILRRRAMDERTTVEHVAETVVSADRVLSGGNVHLLKARERPY